MLRKGLFIWVGLLGMGITAISSAQAAPSRAERAPQGRVMNIAGVAQCLAQVMDAPDFDAMNARYRFGAVDLILPYLALYSDMRWPVESRARRLQEEAHLRWATRWERAELKLAQDLLALAGRGPWSIRLPDAWKLTQRSCRADDPFCSSLLLHNVLRTLGRHRRACETRSSDGTCLIDHNPQWFKEDAVYWRAIAPLIEVALAPLSPTQPTGGYGGWYHFAGIMAFAARTAALGDDVGDLLIIMDINRYGNPIFTGGGDIQDTEGALRDQDTVYIAERLFGPARADATSGVDCSDWKSYLRQ